MSDRDHDDSSKLPVVVRTVIEAAVAAAPTVVDLFFGPGAGIAAAGVSSLGPRVGDAVAARLSRRVGDVADGARAAGIDFDALAEAIEKDELVMELWRRSLRAGIESPWQQKRRALGRAMAEGSLGELGFDKELHLRVIQGLEAVEEWDIKVLEYVDGLPERVVQFDASSVVSASASSTSYTTLDQERGGTEGEVKLNAKVVREEELLSVFIPDVVDFVVENLESAGLIDNVGLGTYNSISMWTPTRIGLEVLRLIRAAAEEEQGT
jgi:hypothetical protein